MQYKIIDEGFLFEADIEELREAVQERLTAMQGDNLLHASGEDLSRWVEEVAFLKAELHRRDPAAYPLPF